MDRPGVDIGDFYSLETWPPQEQLMIAIKIVFTNLRKVKVIYKRFSIFYSLNDKVDM